MLYHVLTQREIIRGDCVLFSSVGLWAGRFLGVKTIRSPYLYVLTHYGCPPIAQYEKSLKTKIEARHVLHPLCRLESLTFSQISSLCLVSISAHCMLFQLQHTCVVCIPVAV